MRLPLPLTDAYDYKVPDGLTLAAGDFVRVPLGPRRMAGVVWGKGSGDVPEAKMKAVVARLDVPPMTDEARAFVDWVAEYTLNPPGAVLRMADAASCGRLGTHAGEFGPGTRLGKVCF